MVGGASRSAQKQYVLERVMGVRVKGEGEGGGTLRAASLTSRAGQASGDPYRAIEFLC